MKSEFGFPWKLNISTWIDNDYNHRSTRQLEIVWNFTKDILRPIISDNIQWYPTVSSKATHSRPLHTQYSTNTTPLPAAFVLIKSVVVHTGHAPYHFKPRPYHFKPRPSANGRENNAHCGLISTQLNHFNRIISFNSIKFKDLIELHNLNELNQIKSCNLIQWNHLT